MTGSAEASSVFERRRWRAATAAVLGGGVIACPTESSYGLSCDPLQQDAVSRLLSLKRRSWRQGLILIAADVSQLTPYVLIPAGHRTRLQQPAPVTWLVPAGAAVPLWVRGEHRQVAVRISAHPMLQSLCSHAGPVVSTSANPTGQAPAMSTQRVRTYFGNAIDVIVPGPLGGLSGPTEIRDLLTDAVRRPAPAGG